MNRLPTLSEVARKAGVGTTTVSRVINGGDCVRSETLAHVRRVIEEMGYMPNQAARVLKGDRTRIVGLIIPSIADPFFASCAEAAQEVARANDSLLVVTTTQNETRAEIENIQILVTHRADGLIIAPAEPRNSGLRSLLDRISMPVVCIDRPVTNSSIPSVLSDNFTAAKAAVAHLIEHGRKHIACLTGERSLYTIQERIRGYSAALHSAGLQSAIDTSVTDYKSAECAIERLLGSPNPPDAFFTLKNSTTIYAFEALQKLKVAVPEAMALVGFDDFQLASTLCPPISVVRQPIEDIGRMAAELLFEQLLPGNNVSSRARAGRAQRVIVRANLVPRGSCGCIQPPVPFPEELLVGSEAR